MAFFFHPDFTVGPGLSPSQPETGKQLITFLSRVADCTASREFPTRWTYPRAGHPTPKNFLKLQRLL